jgi:hypothetical protein
MAKIEIGIVAQTLKQEGVAPDIMRRIIDTLNIEAQPDPVDEKEPTIKKQFVILLSDPEGKLPKEDLVGWVLCIPEDESPQSTLERIYRGAYDFNASKRGRMLPVASVGEALENAGKYLKEAELWVRTKTPVSVIVTDNKIPADTTKE